MRRADSDPSAVHDACYLPRLNLTAQCGEWTSLQRRFKRGQAGTDHRGATPLPLTEMHERPRVHRILGRRVRCLDPPWLATEYSSPNRPSGTVVERYLGMGSWESRENQ